MLEGRVSKSESHRWVGVILLQRSRDGTHGLTYSSTGIQFFEGRLRLYKQFYD